MKLKEILSAKGSKVSSIDPEKTIKEALAMLISQKIGALLVLEKNGKVAGILSERDIMRECHKKGKDWESLLVRQAMTAKIIVGSPEDEVGYIMGVMTQNRVRHIPIFENGKLAGMVSIGDVVKAQLTASQYENHYLKEYISGGKPAEGNESAS